MASNQNEWKKCLADIFKMDGEVAGKYAKYLERYGKPWHLMSSVSTESSHITRNKKEVVVKRSALIVPAFFVHLLLRNTKQCSLFDQLFPPGTVLFIRDTGKMTYEKFFTIQKKIFDDPKLSVKISFLAKGDGEKKMQQPFLGDLEVLQGNQDLDEDEVLDYEVFTMFLNTNKEITFYYSSINSSEERKGLLVSKVVYTYGMDYGSIDLGLPSIFLIDTGNLSMSDGDPSDDVDLSDICCVCMAKESTHANTSCGHRSVCEECGKKVDKCPICRKPIEKIQKIFL